MDTGFEYIFMILSGLLLVSCKAEKLLSFDPDKKLCEEILFSSRVFFCLNKKDTIEKVVKDKYNWYFSIVKNIVSNFFVFGTFPSKKR